jgi:osmoprotectant transport system permease protein
MRRTAIALLLFALLTVASRAAADEKVVVGSKAFPESWILAEAAALLARGAGAAAEHAQSLGGTEITYAGLTSGHVDLYPEYTGTIAEVLLGGAHAESIDSMRRELLRRGIAMSEPLGFNDGYALATSARTAERHHLRTISDLRSAPGLHVGLTHEFLGRADGFPGLAARYGLPFADVRGVQHELALEALARGDLDVIDVYTTDAQIDHLGLRVLDDDRGFFPRYDAVFLYAADLPTRTPRAFAAMMRLVGQIDDARMRRANARLVVDGATVRGAAQGLLHDAVGVDAAEAQTQPIARDIARDTLRHLELVGASLLASVLFGVPLGILATRSRALAFAATSFAGVLQTIPSLALLALLVPVLGIGAKPALAALFFYGLLPIIRGTHVGLTTIPPAITESAEALGLSPGARLFRVLLPIASPHVLAGVRTSAILAVGTATIAALVGAEGLGGPILQGIALRDTALVLEGAIPAALLAIGVDGAFAMAARLVIPRGLQLEREKTG